MSHKSRELLTSTHSWTNSFCLCLDLVCCFSRDGAPRFLSRQRAGARSSIFSRSAEQGLSVPSPTSCFRDVSRGRPRRPGRQWRGTDHVVHQRRQCRACACSSTRMAHCGTSCPLLARLSLVGGFSVRLPLNRRQAAPQAIVCYWFHTLTR